MTTDALVLAVIRDAITKGERAPHNTVIAERTGLGLTTVYDAMARLKKSGALWVSRIGNCRIVGVPDVGQTAEPTPAAGVEEYSARSLSPDDIEARRVNRWSCNRCGARVEGDDHACSARRIAA